MPITYLATKSAAPIQSDYAKAMRVLAYAATTKNRVMFFKAEADLTLRIYADAAHMLHKDGKGIVGTMGMKCTNILQVLQVQAGDQIIHRERDGVP